MILIIASSLLGLLSSFLVTKWLRDILYSSGIIGIDQQKKDKPKLPTSGGICLMFGILAGLLFYIFMKRFFIAGEPDISAILALMVSGFTGVFIGLIDDIHLDREHEHKGITQVRKGLKQWQKPLLTVAIAVPLIALGLGSYGMVFPFIGTVEFGMAYPLVLVPLAVVFAANAQNMLAGTNGLEAGLGFVSFLGLGIFALINNKTDAAVVALVTSFSCLGFLFHNWYPSKILPGDSLTYLLGALFAGVVIAGDMEKFGLIIYVPWMIEFVLKARKRFQARSIGKLRENGTLEPPYEKIYSLNHFFMRFNMKEWQVSLSIIFLEVVFIFAGFGLIMSGLL